MNIQETDLLLPGERADDLQYKGLKVIQNPDKFRFGTDAVLLASFTRIQRNAKVADLGTGCGVIPLLLSGRVQTAHITGVEIQPDIADMARRSVSLNGLNGRIEIVNTDLKDSPELLGKARFTCVTANPPYRKRGSGMGSVSEHERIARHEVLCTLEDVVTAASALLANCGRFTMVHQAERLADIMCALRAVKLEPKRLRMVHPAWGKAPNLLLIEALKNGGAHLQVMPPLYVHDEKGDYTDEMKEIYHITG